MQKGDEQLAFNWSPYAIKGLPEEPKSFKEIIRAESLTNPKHLSPQGGKGGIPKSNRTESSRKFETKGKNQEERRREPPRSIRTLTTLLKTRTWGEKGSLILLYLFLWGDTSEREKEIICKTRNKPQPQGTISIKRRNSLLSLTSQRNGDFSIWAKTGDKEETHQERHLSPTLIS